MTSAVLSVVEITTGVQVATKGMKKARTAANGAPTRRSDAPKAKPRRPERAALLAILDELEARIDTLADRMLERYLVAIPSYRSLPDETLRQVRMVNKTNLVGFIGSLRIGKGPSVEDLARITASASRRAREGVPLSALLAAYRLGSKLAWGEALSLVGTDQARIRAGLELATEVMSWVDEVSGAVAQAYLEESERLWSDREAARRDFVDGLLGGALTHDEVVARAVALGLDPDAPTFVAVVAAEGRTEDEETLRASQHIVHAQLSELKRSKGILAVRRGPEIVVLFPAGNEGPEGLASALGPVLRMAEESVDLRLRAGIGRARELVDLSASYREAAIALSAARAQGTPYAIYGTVLLEELLLRERGVARRLAQTILEPLAGHPELRTTLVEYVQHGPALPSVAKRLFLHPNTVAYRLQRIRELTGRDPKTPQGIAELFIALRAIQLVGED